MNLVIHTNDCTTNKIHSFNHKTNIINFFHFDMYFNAIYQKHYFYGGFGFEESNQQLLNGDLSQ